MDDSLDCEEYASSLKQDTLFFKARYLVIYKNRVSCNIKYLLNTDDLPADESLDCEEDAVGKEAKSASIEPLVGHPRAIVAH